MRIIFFVTFAFHFWSIYLCVPFLKGIIIEIEILSEHFKLQNQVSQQGYSK